MEKLTLIMCVDNQWGVGKDNDLLVKIPFDMAHFKRRTVGKAVIMGRKTFESLPQALPDRLNIVVTRSTLIEESENVITAESLLEARIIAREFDLDAVLVGGAELVSTHLSQIDEAWITFVDKDYGAQIHIPNLEEKMKFHLAAEMGVFQGVKVELRHYIRK
jgi:dihydrofolate reductase